MRFCFMGASKSERRLAIWVGIIIGVAASSMLVKTALQRKDEKDANRPGNFESLRTAKEGKPFDAVPEELRERFPNAIVVYFEQNATVGPGDLPAAMRSWVIETTGSFRSERLFVLADEIRRDANGTKAQEVRMRYSRASEALVKIRTGVTRDHLEELLDGRRFKVIGKNKRTDELVVQFRDVSPKGVRTAIRSLVSLRKVVEKVSPSPFVLPSG